MTETTKSGTRARASDAFTAFFNAFGKAGRPAIDAARRDPRRFISLTLLAFAAIAQLGLCANIVARDEAALARGKAAFLRVEGVDPLDPFRGRYLAIRLSDFGGDFLDVPEGLSASSSLLLRLETASDGSARPLEILEDTPETRRLLEEENEPWIMLRSSNGTLLEPELDRYYVNEADAPLAESLFNAAKSRMLKVRVKSGEMKIEDLLLDGKSVRERIREERGR